MELSAKCRYLMTLCWVGPRDRRAFCQAASAESGRCTQWHHLHHKTTFPYLLLRLFLADHASDRGKSPVDPDHSILLLLESGRISICTVPDNMSTCGIHDSCKMGLFVRGRVCRNPIDHFILADRRSGFCLNRARVPT